MSDVRVEAKWIDSFVEVFTLCGVQPGDVCAVLSETQSRPSLVRLSELALARLGARWFHFVLPTPRQTAPVPVRSTGASDAIGWEACKRARAAENMVYLISANAGGIDGPLPSASNMGFSKIIDYNGMVLANTNGPGENLSASAMIDVSGLRRARQQPGPLNRLLRQRNEIYMPVYEKAAFYPPNSFPDGVMDSKQRIMEIQQDTLRRMGERGIINEP